MNRADRKPRSMTPKTGETIINMVSNIKVKVLVFLHRTVLSERRFKNN